MDKDSIIVICQVVSAIGSLSTFGMFLFLFRKDKDKQSQINKLANIATLLEAQNEVMSEHNDLVFQQVEIFRNTKILNGYDNEALSELRNIEEKKLKLSVRPNLWLNGAGYSGYDGELKIDLNNKGEVAFITNFNLTSSDIILHNEYLPYELEGGQRRYIFARSKGIKHIKDSIYSIEILYKDKISTQYSVLITGEGANVTLSEPKEIGSV